MAAVTVEAFNRLAVRLAQAEARIARFVAAGRVIEVVETVVAGAGLATAADIATAVAPLAVAATVTAALNNKANASDVTTDIAAAVAPKQNAATAVNDGNLSAKLAGALTSTMVANTGASITVDWSHIPGGGFSGTDELPIEP